MLVKASLHAVLSSALDTLTLLLRRLQDQTTQDKIQDRIPKKSKQKCQELDNPIIPLDRPEKEDDTPDDSNPGKYMIKITIFDSGTTEERIIFVDSMQKAAVQQNITPGPPMYKCMERVLKGDGDTE